MRSRKLMFSLLAVILVGSLAVGICGQAGAQLGKILRLHGKGFYEIKPNGLKVLHVKGTSYERGYQYGMLLKDEIEGTLSSGITLYALFIGNNDYEKGLKKIIEDKEVMEQFIPPEYREEMLGMADALADEGSNLTYDDIVMWNTVNDAVMLCFGPSAEELVPAGIRHPYPEMGCMTVRASGKATLDGSLIVAKNMDWANTPEMREDPIVIVADPSDGGYGYLAPVYPGWISCFEGMNEKGIAVGLQMSTSYPETMKGAGCHFLTNLILKYADSLDDAINILTVYPRPCGNIHHVADGKTGNSVVIEHTANELAVRYQEGDRDILWTTNHFNCYPGWQGYTGYNMVAQQAEAWGLGNVSTVEAWQESLARIWMGPNGRYERARDILNEKYGKITVEKMIEIISDRYDQKTGKVIGWDEAGVTISAGGDPRNNIVLSEDIQYYKSDKRGPCTYNGGTVWSLVMVPATGDLRIAMAGPVPAQKGPFLYLNLLEELARMR